MTQIATTIKQSKKLIELGIDVNTADMHWHHYIIDNTYELSAHKIEDIRVYDNPNEISAWSLSKLLELMPYPTLDKIFNDKWRCNVFTKDNSICNCGNDCDSPIDAAFEMICHLLENKLI